MKRRTLLVAFAVVLTIFAFVSCSNEVASQAEDKLGSITFASERTISTTVSYGEEVEEMYWFYKAEKLDDGYTTGDTAGLLKPVSVTKATESGDTDIINQGLTGKTLNSDGFSYGYWKIELYGYKSTNDVTNGTQTSGDTHKPKFTATISKLLVNNRNVSTTASIELGDGLETKIVFDSTEGISFSQDFIKSTGKFELEVEDNKGTITVATNDGENDVKVEDGKVTFYDLTYTPRANTDMKGDHTMSFTLTQTLKIDSTETGTEVEVANYTLIFGVREHTTTTIKGDLSEYDQTGSITIDETQMVQDLEPVSVKKVLSLNRVDTSATTGTVNKETTISYSGMSVTYPINTTVTTSDSALSEDRQTTDTTIGLKFKGNVMPAEKGIGLEGENTTECYELTLDVPDSNTTYLTIALNVGTGRKFNTIYHDSTELTKLTGIPGDLSSLSSESYYYDESGSTGILTMYLNHASPIYLITKDAIAEVENTKYYSFDEAYTAASATGTIKLLRPASLSGNITLNKSLTIDLNDQVLDMGAYSIDLTEDKNITLTIKDGKIESSERPQWDGTGFSVKYGNKLALENVTVSDTKVDQYCMSSYIEVEVEVDPDSDDTSKCPEVIIKGSTITTDGKGIINVEVSDEAAYGNTKNLAKITISDSELNSSGTKTVTIDSPSTGSIEDSTIKGNGPEVVTLYGGAHTIKNSTIIFNESDRDGGSALKVSETSAAVDDSCAATVTLDNVTLTVNNSNTGNNAFEVTGTGVVGVAEDGGSALKPTGKTPELSGTFSSNVDRYKVAETANVYLTRDNGTVYVSGLANLKTAIEKSNNVALLADINLLKSDNNHATIYIKEDLSLDGCGHKIYNTGEMKDNTPLIHIGGTGDDYSATYANVTLSNLSIENTGDVTGGSLDSGARLINIWNITNNTAGSGSVTFKNVKITSDKVNDGFRGISSSDNKNAMITLDHVYLSIPTYYAINEGYKDADTKTTYYIVNSKICGWAAMNNWDGSLIVIAEDSKFISYNRYNNETDESGNIVGWNDFSCIVVSQKKDDKYYGAADMQFKNCEFTSSVDDGTNVKQDIFAIRNPNTSSKLTLVNCTLNPAVNSKTFNVTGENHIITVNGSPWSNSDD